MRKAQQLLLHTCCADCAIKFLHEIGHSSIRKFKRTVQNNYSVTLYFDNSNIHPRSEYLARQKDVKMIAEKYNLKLIIADWSPKLWFAAIGNRKTNKNLARCRACWKLRLSRTAEKSRELGIPLFSTTLLTSHYQNQKIISKIGKSLENNDLHFLNIKKPGNILKTSGFYKQNYCGCVYSLIERYEQRKELNTSTNSE
ncbi:MAG: epoxyqueuosine reductase QueH [Patescibacteria group bacterium]|nr:epoxyqueuosine reductase QueH [Patescibacteria group bacterium]